MLCGVRKIEDTQYPKCALRQTDSENRKADPERMHEHLEAQREAERLERNQAIQRKHKAKKRDQLKLDPQKWAEYQEYQRTKRREHRQRKALNELMVGTKELLNVTNKDK